VKLTTEPLGARTHRTALYMYMTYLPWSCCKENHTYLN